MEKKVILDFEYWYSKHCRVAGTCADLHLPWSPAKNELVGDLNLIRTELGFP